MLLLIVFGAASYYFFLRWKRWGFKTSAFIALLGSGWVVLAVQDLGLWPEVPLGLDRLAGVVIISIVLHTATSADFKSTDKPTLPENPP